MIYVHSQDNGAIFQLTVEAPNENILKNWLEKEFGDKADKFKFKPITVDQTPDVMIDESGVIYVKNDLHKPWLYWLKKIDREITYQQFGNDLSYVGSVDSGEEKVDVIGNDDSSLPLNVEESLKLRNHSPDGFSWGYNGSGPSQLALAILLNEFQDPYLALEHYQDFKREIICNFEKDYSFFIKSSDIREWLFSKVFNYNKIAEELIQKLILQQRNGLISGNHWKDLSLEQAFLDLNFHYEYEVDKFGFCKIRVSVTQKPEHIVPGWDVLGINEILTDFNYVYGFVYSKSPVRKKIEFSTSYISSKKEYKSEVIIVGCYKNALFHIVLEG